MKIIILITFILSSKAFSATNPPLWRISFLGAISSDKYEEFQDTPIKSPVNTEQQSTNFEIAFTQILLAPIVDLTAGLEYKGISTSKVKPVNFSFKSYYGFLNLGFDLYRYNDFFKLRFILEGFTSTLKADSETFGYKGLWGGQAYPEIIFSPFGTDSRLQISPFLKLPLLTQSDKRKEFTLGLLVNLPLATGRVPYPSYAYKKSLILKLYYRKVDLLFEKSGFLPLDISTEEINLSLGFSF